jgi:hypothetical protein
MNRTLVFGIAMFFAIVAFALMGPEPSAVAGHGGCAGKGKSKASAGRKCDGKAARKCSGRQKRARRCGCAGSKKGGSVEAAAPADAPAPPPAAPAPPAAPKA